MNSTRAQHVSIHALWPASAADSAVSLTVSNCFCKPEASRPLPPSTCAVAGVDSIRKGRHVIMKRDKLENNLRTAIIEFSIVSLVGKRNLRSATCGYPSAFCMRLLCAVSAYLMSTTGARQNPVRRFRLQRVNDPLTS